MRIQHNIAAMTASRQLGILTGQQATLTERLSTGYKINRASDNAAGLKISEKMRAQIRGLNQASQNAQDGISLLQTADGALNEVHSILQRVRELSVQAANDTNVSADRKSIQEEMDELLKEVDRIGGSTEFNTRKIFDGSLKMQDTASASVTTPYAKISDGNVGGSVALNIYFLDEQVENAFATTQTGTGTATATGYDTLKSTLKNEIVPQAVNTLLSTYSDAFGYLSGSSIGIGLNLYTNASTSVLASVGMGVQGYYKEDGTVGYSTQYTLSVNMASLATNSDGTLTDTSRSELEATILHEMVHGFMDEALTNGMMGISNGASDASNKYPLWFIEGMAQTAAGGYANWNDWVNGGLGITSTTSETMISSAVKNSSNKLTSGTGQSSYGTGYLACMYLGFLGSGKDLTQENITAGNLKTGLNKILKGLIGGKSLDSMINEVSGETYTSAADFAGRFGDADSAKFISYLTKAVAQGNGSLVTGSFLSTDLLPDTPASTPLFNLNTGNTTVTNKYPDGVTVLSGGGTTSVGSTPTPDFGTTPTPPPSEPSTASINIGSVTTAGGDGYTFDGSTLTITDNGTYTLTGDNGNIAVKVADGVEADITIQDLNITSVSDSGITLGDGAKVTMKIAGTNTITSDTGAAVKVGSGQELTITGDGSLTATAAGSTGAAAIGSEAGETAGTIKISGDSGKGLVIKAAGSGSVNGIGSGAGGSVANVVKECGVILDGSDGSGGVYGTVEINRGVNIGTGTLTVDSGATLTVGTSGVISGSGSGVTIENKGTVKNHGDIGNAENNTGGSITHYVSAVKTISKPETLKTGEALNVHSSSSIQIKYNGNQTLTLSSTSCSVTDKNGHPVSDPSTIVVGEGDEFDYTMTYQLAEGYSFDGASISSSYEKNNYELFDASKERQSIQMTGSSISPDGRTLTVTYHATTAPAGSNLHGGLKLQVGANEGQYIALDIGKVSTEELGIDGLSVMGYDEANDALKRCDGAISKVSSMRSKIGAYQNRLEYTIDNLDNTAENLQDAESRIRDTDMASTMVEYAKNQILMQVTQSILSQANQSTQGVLTLLQ